MVEFKQFRVEHIFDAIRSTTSIKNFSKSKTPTEKENTPATSATVSNNMFGFYVDSSEHELLDNCISVTANGDGFCCYQPKPFAIAQDSYALINKFTENKYVYIYLVGALSKITPKYNYTNKSGWNRFKEDSVNLPVKHFSDTEPDWEYMENYIKEIETKYIQQVTSEQEKEIELLREKVGNIGEINLSEVQLKEFIVGDLFDSFVVGKQPEPDNRYDLRLEGMLPTTTGVTNSNGVGFYSYPTNQETYSDVITLSKDGEYAGTPYYQKESVIIGGHCLACVSNKINKYSALYIMAGFNKLKEQGFWKLRGVMGSVPVKQLKVSTITLPVKSLSDDEPDWEYMENYIKLTQQKYIEKRESEHAEQLRLLNKMVS